MILAIGWITLYLMGTDLFVVSPLLPLISEHFHVTASIAGWSMTVFSMAYAVLAPLFGHIGDGRGRRLPLVGGLLVFGLANGATAWAPNFSFFLIARFIAGGAAAAITPTVYAAISDLAPSHRRGAWLSFVGSGIFTALWSSAPLGSLMGYRWGWSWVFVILALVPFPLAWANGRILRSAIPLLKTISPTGYRRLLFHVSVTTLWAIAMYATYIYLGVGLKVTAGYSPERIAAAVAIFGVGMVSGVLSGGHLTDRWGPRPITAIGCLGIAFGALALRETLGHFMPAMAALLFFSLCGALYFSSFQVYLAHHHNQRRGAALAWNNSALYLGMTMGSFLGGVTLSYGGFKANLLLSVGAGVLASAWAFYVESD